MADVQGTSGQRRASLSSAEANMRRSAMAGHSASGRRVRLEVVIEVQRASRDCEFCGISHRESIKGISAKLALTMLHTENGSEEPRPSPQLTGSRLSKRSVAIQWRGGLAAVLADLEAIWHVAARSVPQARCFDSDFSRLALARPDPGMSRCTSA